MASPTVTYSTVTTVIAISDYGNGKYDIKEVTADAPSFPELHSGNRKQIEFSLPVPGLAAVGYYDIDDKEIGLYFTLGGSQFGSKYVAGVENGVSIGLNLWLASGSVTVFKKGNELKGKYDISVGAGPFSKSHSDEFHLFNV